MDIFQCAVQSAVAPSLPVIPVNNIQVNAYSLRVRDGIHWIDLGNVASLTADVDLPDGEFMVMFEKIVRGVPVSDERRPAVIANHRLSLQVNFPTSGHYQLSAERLNEGLLDRSAPFRVQFDRIDFDVVSRL